MTTVLVMGCTLLSRILGFVRNIVIAALFGATGQADVLNAVFNIPNNLRKLLAEGALSSAFIPVLSEALVRDPTGDEARRLVRKLVSFLLIVLVPLMLLFVVFARPIIQVFLDFPGADEMELSASLFRWICHYLLFISFSALLMGVLNSRGIFVIPALTPVVFSVCVIGALLLFHGRLGIFAMAVGVLAGGLFQVLVQLPAFLRSGQDLRPDFDFADPVFRRVLRQWLPVVATSSVFAVNQQVAFRFASGLEVGSTTALSLSLVIWQLPFGVFSASITTVLFPRISRQTASGDTQGVRRSINYGLRFLFLLLAPSSVFFILMGGDLVTLVYQRGEFTASDSALTAHVLTGYSLGLFFVGAFTFLQRFFYASRDYRTPFTIAALVAVLDIGLSLWLKETPLRVTGLAVANSVSFTVGFILMILFTRRRLGGIGGRKLAAGLLKVAGALVPTGALLWAAGRWLRSLAEAGASWALAGGVMACFILFSGVTIVLYTVMNVEIVRELLRRRLRK